MVSKNAVSVMHGAALWAATFVSVVAVAGIGSAAYVSFTTTDYAYPRTGGTTNLNATMWNKLIDNVQDIGTRTSAFTASGGNVGIGASPTQAFEIRKTLAGGPIISKVANISATAGTQARFDLATQTANSYGIISLTENGWGITSMELASWNGVTNGMWFTNGTSVDATGTGTGPFVWRHGSAERLRIANNGYVGIGAANPIFKLDVNGSSNAASQCIGGTCLSAWGGIVGGSYTTATSKCAAINNPATGSTSCPTGFTGIVTGRGLCDQSDPSMYVTYLCVKN